VATPVGEKLGEVADVHLWRIRGGAGTFVAADPISNSMSGVLGL